MSYGIKNFEVLIYNRRVRQLELIGEKHPQYNTSWANLQCFTFTAKSESEVISKVRQKYPENKGFFIEKIILVKEYDFIKPLG